MFQTSGSRRTSCSHRAAVDWPSALKNDLIASKMKVARPWPDTRRPTRVHRAPETFWIAGLRDRMEYPRVTGLRLPCFACLARWELRESRGQLQAREACTEDHDVVHT
jgi:hypothetical protein